MAASGDIWRDDTVRNVVDDGGTYTYPVVTAQGVVRSIGLVALEEADAVIASAVIQLIVDGVPQTEADLPSFFGQMGSYIPTKAGEGTVNMEVYYEEVGSPVEATGFVKVRIPFDTSFAIKVTNNVDPGGNRDIDFTLCRVEFALVG